MKRRSLIVGFVPILLALVLAGAAWAANPDQPRRFQDQFARGDVRDVRGEHVILETEGGDQEVLISDRTVLWLPGEPPTRTIQLSAGDPVLAFGQYVLGEAGSRTLSARLLLVASEQELPRVLIRGPALVVTQQTIVVQSGNRERAITVLPRARLWSVSGRLGSLGEVHPGDPLIALGQPTGLGQWMAGLVMIAGPEGTGQRGLRGTIVALDAVEQALTVQIGAGNRVTVLTSTDTTIRIPGIENAELADLRPGDRVAALGHFDLQDSSRFLAWGIGMLAPPDESED